MIEFALTLPDKTSVTAPSQVPTGGLTTLQKIIQTGVNVLIIFAIILALFFMIYAGYQWMTSGGDKEKLHKAQQSIVYVIIGLVVVFLSGLIINIIGNFFKTPLL